MGPTCAAGFYPVFPSYIVFDTDGNGKAIQCLVCRTTSYNPNDVAQRYCGHCHHFHEDDHEAAQALRLAMQKPASRWWTER